MAKPGNQRNNSDQMRAALTDGSNSENQNKSDEDSGKNKLSSAGSSSSSSSSSAASSNKATSKQGVHHDSSKVNDPVPDNYNSEICNEASCSSSTSSSTSFSSSPSFSSAPSHGGAVKPQIEFDHNSKKCNTEKDECQEEHFSKENSSQVAPSVSTTPSPSSSSTSSSSSSSTSSSTLSSSSTSSFSEPSSSEAMANQDHQQDKSINMKELRQQFDPLSAKYDKEKYEHDRKNDDKQNSSQAGCSCSCNAAKSSGAGGRGHPEMDDPMDGSWKDGASSCFQLDDLKRLPQCNNQLRRLEFSRRHTVLINVKEFNTEGKLLTQEGRDVWSSDVVKMPCSGHSTMEIKTGLMRQLTKVWRWKVITEQLENLSKKTHVSVHDVEEAIKKYNPRYAGEWSFDALSAFVQSIPPTEKNYFPTLVPKIAALALKLPKYVKKPIRLLQKKNPAMITLSQVQISCLLANAFFCTFPHRNTTSSKAEYGNFPTINFSSLFGNKSERKKEKLRAIMHYFDVVTDEKTKPTGLVTFERRCIEDMNIQDWKRCQNRMPKLYVTSDGTIETEGTGMLQVDFASSWIGGGVLSSGLVQEEILFLINPELIVSRLFTEKLEDNECLIITGSQRFSCYSGFGDSFEWMGPHEEKLSRDEWKRLKRQILVIDALHFRNKMDQYSMSKVMRELNKAFCGFKGQGGDEPDIATGKWGCGAFNGDPELKAVIQLMAAARANRGLAFFTFQDELLEKDLQQIHHLLVTARTTVGDLYRLLEDFCIIQRQTDGSHSLFEFIKNTIRRPKSPL